MNKSAPNPRRFEYDTSARRFAWYELQEADVFACQCGWTGVFSELDHEWFEALVDGSCRSCGTMLAIRSHATFDEIRRAAAAGDPEAIKELPSVDEMERRQDRARTLELTATSELPPLTGARLRFSWDFEEANGENWTVIRCEGVDVWRELAFFGGRERFAEVESLLQGRFGERFEVMLPTEASKLYLFGD